MFKYLGSKRRILPRLLELVDELGPLQTAADLFTGTTRVARALKLRGLRVHANDHLAASATLARAAIATDGATVDRERLHALLVELSATPAAPGWFTRDYAENARYLHPDNAARVEAMRMRLDTLAPAEPERSLLLSALLLAADRVDSTTGVQMAFLKSWAPRALGGLDLRPPELLDGEGSASQLDAAECARRLGPVDLAYLDPPYNQHSYLGNYHVWETLTLFDEPETYGTANKRVDVRTRKSAWNSKRLIRGALDELLDAVDARWILMSFNDEGYLPPDELAERLAKRGELRRVDLAEHPRYVGAKIGIHSPSGEKVGTVGKLTNTESLYLVRCH